MKKNTQFIEIGGNDMHNIDSTLKLSYSPLTAFEFENSKKDKDIEEYLNNTSIYVIAKRPLPIMKLIKGDVNGFHILVTMEGYKDNIQIVMTKDDNPKLFGQGLSAIRKGSNLIGDTEHFHSITLYRINGEYTDENPGDFIINANFDRLIHLASNKAINLRIKGDITPFVSYEVLYVGECVNEHIFKRFKAHHALQNILIKENIIPPNYDKVNDLLIMPFTLENEIVSCITGHSTETEFFEAMSGKFPFGGKDIALDCEKALVHAMNPKYNKTKFKQYPKSKDGLFTYNLGSYLYRILENIVLCYDEENKIYGNVERNKASIISVIDNNKFSILDIE